MENNGWDVVDVVSSVINKVGFNETDHDLFIEFKSGKQYLYHEVPKDEFDSLVNAESVGEYFAENIKEDFDCMEI